MALMVRDRQPAGVRIAGLLLGSPMLDNQVEETEKRLFSGDAAPAWSSESNDMAWKAYLEESAESAENPYHVPSRVTDLTKLPPTYVDVGTADLFRKPATRFAERLWESGGSVEFHAWPGAYHAFDLLAPAAALSKKATDAKMAWARGVLGS